MKIVSFNEISKCMRRANNLLNSGIYSLYGRGKDTVVIDSITPGDSLADIYNTQYGQYRFEFGNLTIGEGVDLPVTNDYQFAFLKVNGTLVVNGHLHMDGRGGIFTDQRGTIISVGGVDTYTYNTTLNSFSNYGVSQVSDTASCSDDLWYRLTTYGAQETFFTQSTALTGAGGNGYTRHLYEYTVRRQYQPEVTPYDKIPGTNQYKYGYYRSGWGHQNTWVWTGYQQYLDDVEANSYDAIETEYRIRGSQSTSYLSGGGNLSQLPYPITDEGITCGGGGGGFIALYSETISNAGNKFTEGDETYPLNVHANGGSSIHTDGTLLRGGGCLIIAARHIVIGPNGSITADGGDGNGLMTLLNRNPNKRLYTYSSGSPVVYTNTFSGGAGYAQHFVK